MTSNRQPKYSWMRGCVICTVGVALGIELVARYLSAQGSPVLLSKSLSLVALAMLGSSALYLIFRLQELACLKWLIVVAFSSMMVSQIFRTVDDIGYFDSWMLIGKDAQWHNAIESTGMLVGTVLMLATFYLALVETVFIQRRLLRERGELSREIDVRNRTEAALQESYEQIRRLSAHLTSAREEERASIAREIHDELGQALTSLRIDLVGLEQQVTEMSPPNERPGVADQLRTMTALVAETMASVRKIITELRPGILDDLGLTAAIEWQAKEFEKRVGFPCTVALAETEVPLGREKTIALFRILQEALTNVVRHAQATAASIKLSTNGGCVTLEIADNGKGIADIHAAAQGSFGILGIQERAAQFRGACSIRSALGQGTRLAVTLPLDPPDGTPEEHAVRSAEQEQELQDV